MSLQKRKLAELLIFLYVFPPAPTSPFLLPAPLPLRTHLVQLCGCSRLINKAGKGWRSGVGWSTSTRKFQRLEMIRPLVIPGAACGAGKSFSSHTCPMHAEATSCPVASVSPAEFWGRQEHRGLQCVKPGRERSHLCPPRDLIRLKGTSPRPPIRISTFHSALLLFCTAPAASPASFSASFLSPPHSLA